MMNRFYILVCTLVCVSALARAGLPTNASPVEFGEGKSKQTFKDLVVADFPEFDTRVIFPKKGISFPGCKGIVLVYPGTSAKVDSDAGAEKSLAPLANEILKRGYAVLAFQPPIYFKANSEAERAPYLERYGNLEGNLDWLVSTVELAKRLTAADGETPLFLVGRSTFAAIGLEAYHRYLARDPKFESFENIRRVAVMGLYGHTAEQIDEWYQVERNYYYIEKPDRGDPPVIEAAPKIFSSMTHQTQRMGLGHDYNRPLPSLIATHGSRDEFAQGRLPSLFAPILAFSENHSVVPVSLVWHDGHHNPSREIRDSNQVRIASPMARMKGVLDLLFDTTVTPTPGLRVHYLPDEEQVLKPLSISQIHQCKDLISNITH